MRVQLTDAEVERVVALRRSGLSNASLMNTTGMKWHVIREILRAYGFTGRPDIQERARTVVPGWLGHPLPNA